MPRKGPDAVDFEPLELWLVPAVTTKLEKRLGVDVVIKSETQKAVAIDLRSYHIVRYTYSYMAYTKS